MPFLGRSAKRRILAPEDIPDDPERPGTVLVYRSRRGSALQYARWIVEELDCDVAVGLDVGIGQSFFFSELLVVPQYPIVGKSKSRIPGKPGERVIVVVVLFITLCGHACVTHDCHCSLSKTEMQLVRRFGALENHYVISVNVTNAGSVSATLFRSV